MGFKMGLTHHVKKIRAKGVERLRILRVEVI